MAAATQSTSDKSTKIRAQAKPPRKWSPAQRKKFRQTMKLKRSESDHKPNGKSIAAKKKGNGGMTTLDKDIIVTLMEAEQSAFKALKEEKIKRFTRDQLLTMLALNSVLES